MFVIIRSILCVIFLIIGLFIIRKLTINKKRSLYVICVIIIIFLGSISNLFPIENKFITFASPESAFNYMNFGNVNDIVSGKNTDMVIATKGDLQVYSIIPKTNEGWKISVGLNTKKIIKKFYENITIYVYQYKNTEEYYIKILNKEGGRIEIVDNINSNFHCLIEKNNTLEKDFYTYIAYIHNFNNQYLLTVDGITISFSENSNDISAS